MKRFIQYPLFVLLSLTLVMSAATTQNADAQSYYAVNRAENLLGNNASGILGFAHPTGTYSSYALGEAYALRNGGFGMTLRVYFEDMWGSSNYSDIEFYFTESGLLDSIGSGRTSDGFPAFAASGLILETIRYAILEDDSLDAESRAVIRQIPDAKSLVLYLLKLGQLIS